MNLENQLINKSYYTTIIEDNDNIHPIKVLSEKYMEEQQNEVSDFSDIRFAQGEVYYRHKDYEAAIFKWENVSNELKPWAQKNIGDAHLQLNLLAIAEEYYKAVETDSSVLKTELLMQLFILYIKRSNYNLASVSIKEAVDLYPGYPDVTATARSFFEEQADWDAAVELAANEAVRTESQSWFKVLETYIDEGHAKNTAPRYFKEVITAAFYVDRSRFDNLAAALWNNYMHTGYYFQWLEEINHILLQLELGDEDYIWKLLPGLYEETYDVLIDGRYLIREVFHLLPSHLTNWMRLTANTDASVSASALLAWSRIFPSNIDASLIDEAEKCLFNHPSYRAADGVMDAYKLFEAVKDWGEAHDTTVDERIKWMVKDLISTDTVHLLLTGKEVQILHELMEQITEGQGLAYSHNGVTRLQDAEEAELHAVTETEARYVDDSGGTSEELPDEEIYFDYKTPAPFLRENHLSMITVPEKDIAMYLPMADGLLFAFAFDSRTTITDAELDMAVKMRGQKPDLPMCILLGNTSTAASNQEQEGRIDIMKEKIHTFFPDAQILTVPMNTESSGLRSGLPTFLPALKQDANMEREQAKKILFYTEKSIQLLKEKRLERERILIQNIKDNKELVRKLEGAHGQLSDIQKNKVQAITESYNSIINHLQEKMVKEIPGLLQSCSKYVREDEDFETMLRELNEEMNKQVAHYFEETAMPLFRSSMNRWMEESEEEFKNSQIFLRKTAGNINKFLGEERLDLHGDMQILEDWQRDVTRITSRSVKLEKNDLVSHPGSSTILFKGAGKLAGSIPQYRERLYNKYKQYIESKDYSEAAASVTEMFMQQFELFEKSLERDIHLFFTEPEQELKRTVSQTHKEIEEDETSLRKMRENPEEYEDPLTFFELRLHQYKWMSVAGNSLYEYH
ncbi:tetratricopeptide repeat protein [Virgibacillus xinjiangensis]|uniref:Tetratricopeptide repeat protein n=1 Tax=Virgibacillus xinjiangensis TaxID=393090 RepID=A0ABV7CRG4_9BACI